MWEFLRRRREVTLVVVIAILMAVITLRANDFLNPKNLYDILNDTTILMIVAAGQLMVILTAGIDLSVASTMGFTGMAVALLNHAHPGIPLAVLILIGLAIGLGLGAFNGLLVSVFKIPPIITTLGTLNIYRGFIVVISGGAWVSADEMTAPFRDFPREHILGTTTILFTAIVVLVLVGLFLRYTRTGREIYGVGGNSLAAQFVGISLPKINFFVYAASGVFAAMGGLLWVMRYASAQNDTAMGFELETIAACVLGGVSIAGGSGTLVGVIFGAAFLGIVKNALTMVRISPFWQTAIQGFVILLAIVINSISDARNAKRLAQRRSVA
ncbi:MAG TPA: ABC transporter permease [Spirochaetia bacterium]|nr:ABC transporter permease [Spirochaetia bacterium]